MGQQALSQVVAQGFLQLDMALLQAQYELALDYFSRAFERQHTGENLGNVLCTLIRLGDVPEAQDLLDRVQSSFPLGMVREINDRIRRDPDLSLLNTEK